MSIKKFNEAIETIRAPTGHSDVDEMLNVIAHIVEHLRNDYLLVFNELMTMYTSAAEHNVDVSRDAIYDLAKRMVAQS